MAIDTEDYGCVLFRFKGGARGSLWVSQVTAGRKNCIRYEIAGSNSALAWNSESPNELWIGRRDKPNELLIRDPALVGQLARGFLNYPGGHNEGFPDTFKQCFRAFYGYIAAGDFAAAPAVSHLRPRASRGAALRGRSCRATASNPGSASEGRSPCNSVLSVPSCRTSAWKKSCDFAAAEGFQCVELMCWPRGKAERRYAGVTHVDVGDFGPAEAEESAAIHAVGRRGH